MTISGAACRTGLTIGETMANPNGWSVALGCAREAVAVAAEMEVGDPIAHIPAPGGNIARERRSMLLDYNAGCRGNPPVSIE